MFKPRSLRHGIRLVVIFTLFAKMVGYARQLLVAYRFGVSRDLDIYLMANNITMVLLFAFTLWFDQLAVPHLIHVRESQGEPAFRAQCGSMLAFSFFLAVAMAALYLALILPSSWLFGHGFTAVERSRVCYMALFFVPWVLIIFPYNALSAIFKSMRLYDVVVLSDFVVTLLATGAFALWHRHLITLPLSLSFGYILVFAGLLVLAARRHVQLWGSLRTSGMRIFYQNVRRMFAVNQTHIFSSGVERFFQSYLHPGSIAAMGYAYQTMSPIFEVLSFDELYVISLSSLERQQERLDRLLKGLVLLTIPLTVFLIWQAPNIIHVLYEHGRFDQNAQDLTVRIFRILTLTLITGTICTPLIRFLQIKNHVFATGYVSLISTVGILISSTVFIFVFHWTVIGAACASVGGSATSVLLAFYYLKKVHLKMNFFSVAKYVAWAAASSLICITAISLMPVFFKSTLFNLLLTSALYSVILALCYRKVYANIRFILYG